jgi:hypothetical protein
MEGSPMKWFKHDSTAHIDAKLRKLKHKHGIIGYGLYWYCLELIAGDISSKNITFELEYDAETIANEWGLDQIKVQDMMSDMVKYGLFENGNGRITCLKMAYRLDDTNSKNPQMKQIINSFSPKNSEELRETPNNSGQIRLDKKRIEDNNKGSKSPTKKFIPPSLEDVSSYCKERSNNVDPEAFIDWYQGNGWMRGKAKIKDWKACVRTWEKKDKSDSLDISSQTQGAI